jgi:hypothetical protein
MVGRPKVERKHGRIYVGEGDECWSLTDPESDRKLSLAGDWYYILLTCPDTKTALEKVRLIRWALRNVPVGASTPGSGT